MNVRVWVKSLCIKRTQGPPKTRMLTVCAHEGVVGGKKGQNFAFILCKLYTAHYLKGEISNQKHLLIALLTGIECDFNSRLVR